MSTEKEHKVYNKPFLNSLVPYNADKKALDELAMQYPEITTIADKKELSLKVKELQTMKKSYDVIKRSFKTNADTIRNAGNNLISNLEIEFKEMTTLLKDKITRYKEVIDTFKKEQANILSSINTLSGQTLNANQTVLGGEQMHEDSDFHFNLESVDVKSDKEIIDFIGEMIVKTNMKIVAKANDFKGIQIYHSNEPGSSMDPRVALSIMIDNYNKQ